MKIEPLRLKSCRADPSFEASGVHATKLPVVWSLRSRQKVVILKSSYCNTYISNIHLKLCAKFHYPILGML